MASKRLSRWERPLAGLSASLLVLGLLAVVGHSSPHGTTRASAQVAPGPVTAGVTPEGAAPTTTTSTAVPAKTEVLVPLGPPPSRPEGPSFVANALGPSLDVFSSPAASQPARRLDNPQPSGAPLVLLVRSQQPGWLEVLLPIRPNGSSGWVKRSQVGVSETDFYIVIGLGAHRITVFDGSTVVLDERVGLGNGGTPTPTGLFYIKELLQPPNSSGPYGPYAYGLSAFSEVLFSFGGGPGTVGVHGTNDPSSLGRNVSNGCIRMSNAGVTRLAKTLPLGVPVQISRE